MKLKPSEPAALDQRLTVRMTGEDWAMLRELQACLHQQSAGRTVRTLIRMHHGVERAAVRRLRKDPHFETRLDAIVGVTAKTIERMSEKPIHTRRRAKP